MAAERSRLLRYQVATSLDGFIAGPNGEYDWITEDPTLDLEAFARQFDTLLMGRLTYELALSQGSMLKSMGMTVVVVSTTLDPSQHPDATIISTDVAEDSSRSSSVSPAKTSGCSAAERSSAQCSTLAWLIESNWRYRPFC